MSYALVSGASVVSLDPESNLKYDHRKIENAHRTRSGANYRYTWGSYRKASFDVEFLTSADACTINSWWSANAVVKLYDVNSAVVVSGYLVNAEKPIGKIMKPYTDLFMGTIELESF